MVDEELDKMKYYEDRNEGVEMNIKTEAPLYILISHGGFHQPVVGDVPQSCSDHQTNLEIIFLVNNQKQTVEESIFYPDEIHKYHVEQKFYKSPEVDAEDEREASLEV